MKLNNDLNPKVQNLNFYSDFQLTLINLRIVKIYQILSKQNYFDYWYTVDSAYKDHFFEYILQIYITGQISLGIKQYGKFKLVLKKLKLNI